jgi:hypothetical protein
MEAMDELVAMLLEQFEMSARCRQWFLDKTPETLLGLLPANRTALASLESGNVGVTRLVEDEFPLAVKDQCFQQDLDSEEAIGDGESQVAGRKTAQPAIQMTETIVD